MIIDGPKMASYQLSGIGAASSCYNEMQGLKASSESAFKALSSAPHQFGIEVQSLRELVRCRRVLGENVRLSRLPLDTSMYLALIVTLGGEGSLDEDDRKVVLSMASECLLSLRDRLKGSGVSGASKDVRSIDVDIEDSGNALNIGDQEKCLQTLLGCFKFVVDLALKNSSAEVVAFAGHYFGVMKHLQRSIGNVRKVFSKYMANDVLNCCLESLARPGEGNEAINSHLLAVIRETFFGDSSIDEMFRVSVQIVNSKEALIVDGGSNNPYRKLFICIHYFCHSGRQGSQAGAVAAFGKVFYELLNACLRKCKAAADKHSTYDKKSVQMTVKVCSAFLFQAGKDDGQGLFRNELLCHVSEVSSTLLTYDTSGDLLELYSKLWLDTKARLPKALEASSGELSTEVECLKNILTVHHRLVLEGEEELDHMCSVALAGNGRDSELGQVQVELMVLLLDLYHRLGRLSEVLSSVIRVSRGDEGLVAAPLVSPRRKVLGSDQVQRLLSVSFAELSVLQAAELWKLLAEQSKLAVNLELAMQGPFMASLSLLCRGIVSVVMSRPSSKRVIASRVTVPVEPTFVMIEACLDVVAGIDSSSRQEAGLQEVCSDTEALAASLLRVGSLLICQVSSREMEVQREQWRSYISLVLNKWVKTGSHNEATTAIASSNVSLFSAIVFVYIAQMQCGLTDELKDTEDLVSGFVRSYGEQISAGRQGSSQSHDDASSKKGKGRKRKLQSAEAAPGAAALLPPAWFDAPLVQHADILSVIFASQECAPLYHALLTECKFLMAPSDAGAGGGVPEGLHVASPVLAKTLELCLSSTLERLKGVQGLEDSASPSQEISLAVKALEFYRDLAAPATETPRPLNAEATQTLGDILLLLASKSASAHPKGAKSSRTTVLPEFCRMAELVSELLLAEIKGSATVSASLVSSLGGSEGLIVGLIRFTEQVVADSETAHPNLCTICQVLIAAIVENAVALQDAKDCKVVPLLCEAILPSSAAADEKHERIRSQMALTLSECLSGAASSLGAEAGKSTALAASKAVACSSTSAIVLGKIALTLDSCSQALNCLGSCKAMLIQLQLQEDASDIISTASGLLRQLVTQMAAATPSADSEDLRRSLEPWLVVLGDLLEIHRKQGLLLEHGSDAVFIFNSVARWLSHISDRSEASRLALVRALMELLVLSRGQSEGLTAAIVTATRTVRDYSSDSMDSARALFSAQLVRGGSGGPAAVSAARDVLLDASTKVFGSILSRPQSSLGSSLADTLPEEAAFFRCLLPGASTGKKRKSAEEGFSSLDESRQTDAEASMLSMKAIDTYAVLAAQAHTLLQQQPGGAQLALELCRPCLAALQEIGAGAAGQLSFCFPLFSTAVSRIAHCLLLIGPEFHHQKQAVGAVRRIMLTVASTKGLTRFFALFAAAMIEVLVACGSDGRQGAEPLVSGIFTLADRCNGLGRKSTIMPLLSPAARELFAGMMDKFGAAFKYKG